MKVMGIYCNKELYNRLKDTAWEQRKSLSALVRELVMQSLQQVDTEWKETSEKVTK